MKKHFPIVAFAAVALASLAMAGFAYLAAEEAARIKFEATADDALNRIQSRVDLHLSLLREMDAFFTARAGQVTGGEFSTYFDALQVDKNFEGLQSLGLLGVAKPGEEALLEREISERLNVERPIAPPTSDGDWRMPVLLIEPLDRIRMTGIGYDMFSDPQIREAILAAIETGESRATGRVMLGPQIGGLLSPGFLLFSTLERPGAAESQPIGMLFAAFRTQELVKSALDKFPALPVQAQVFDGASEPANQLLPAGGRGRTRHGFRDHPPVARRRKALDHRISADSGFHASVLAHHPGAAWPVRTAACRRHSAPAALSVARV